MVIREPGALTPAACKKIIAAELQQLGLPYTKLTARTVSFLDLARDSRVFVKIHGWQPNPALSGVEALAKQRGFRVETDWGLG